MMTDRIGSKTALPLYPDLSPPISESGMAHELIDRVKTRCRGSHRWHGIPRGQLDAPEEHAPSH
jgi:hypothetical protein